MEERRQFMVLIQNDCCSCASPGFPCIGERCELLHVPHYYCDNCEEEVDELYWFDGRQLCADCVLNEMEVVKYE